MWVVTSSAIRVGGNGDSLLRVATGASRTFLGLVCVVAAVTPRMRAARRPIGVAAGAWFRFGFALMREMAIRARGVLRHRLLVAARALRGDRGTGPMRLVARQTRRLDVMFRGMAILAFRRLLRAEGVAIQAPSGALIFATMVRRLLRGMAFRANARRWLLVGSRVAFGTCDLLLANMNTVHRRVSRVGPLQGHLLDRRWRERSRLSGAVGKPCGGRHGEREK
jgi:hypothetical protein